MPPRKQKDQGNKSDKGNDSLESDDDDYRRKRDRNNLAVKRSRVKSKMKAQETMARVNQLKSENSVLEEKVKTLTKELGFLKQLFLAHASNCTSPEIEGVDLKKLLEDNDSNAD